MLTDLHSPRQLEIAEVSPTAACVYNNQWHRTQGDLHYYNITRSHLKVCYVAEFEGTVVAVGIWSSPVARAWHMLPILELRRLAIGPDAPKFTASWMLGKMTRLIRIKFPHLEKLISYQDPSEFSGGIYRASNWIMDGTAKAPTWKTGNRQRKDYLSAVRKIRWVYYL